MSQDCIHEIDGRALTYDIKCNDSCCTFGDGYIICFGECNFTDRSNLTYTEPWELGVRWTYTLIVTLMGFFGNLTIITILLKNRLLLRTSVNIFILNMSVADLILSCAGPVLFTIRDTNQFFVFGETWCHMEGVIQIMVMMVSVTSLAVISFDRMLGIVLPFHDHLKIWHSISIISVIWIISGLLSIPFGIYRIYTVRVWKDLTETTCGEDRSKIKIWWIIIVIGLTWLPLLIMLISYTTIFIYLRYSWRNPIFQKEHPALTHLKKRVMRMMFAVVIGFIICWLPFQGLKLFTNKFINDSGQFIDESKKKPYNALMSVSHYMFYTNSAINPIVYALMHQTFRRAFRITFSCFYNRKSAFVLTRGVGTQTYVWSLKSTAQNVYGKNMVNNPKSSKLIDLIKRNNQVTSSAVVSSSAMVAAIALDPSPKPIKISEENPTIKKEGMEEGEGKGEEVCKIQKNGAMGKGTLLSYVNEGYVTDLPQRRTSIVSTGALSHLITQVIEEETSSDADNERIL